MRLPKGIRGLFGIVAFFALLIGVFLWGAPAEFSGAEVGDSVECTSGVCKVYQAPDWRDYPDVEDFSDLPITLIFEGTETEVSEWTRQQHVDAMRPIAISWLAGAVVLGGLALYPPRRRRAGPDADDH